MTNTEIKAYHDDLSYAEAELRRMGAQYVSTHHEDDYYLKPLSYDSSAVVKLRLVSGSKHPPGVERVNENTGEMQKGSGTKSGLIVGSNVAGISHPILGVRDFTVLPFYSKKHAYHARDMLEYARGIDTVVPKDRTIYLLDSEAIPEASYQIHLDMLENKETFLELELKTTAPLREVDMEKAHDEMMALFHKLGGKDQNITQKTYRQLNDEGESARLFLGYNHIIKESPFSLLSQEDRRQLATLPIQRYNAGDLVIEKGMVQGDVTSYLIIEGEVDVCNHNGQLVSAKMGAGKMVGEMPHAVAALYGGRHPFRQAQVRAGDKGVHVIPIPEAMMERIRQHPQMIAYLARRAIDAQMTPEYMFGR